ncbi:SAM-dependent methyltransferase [Vibrio salinus]|uniref:SAM-dependent methyltransferase n=1 Tax=Vibrio salinus TaxID=2899784 RepID=UPI001E38A23E|nr:cyclopropane-fatty-acyl-phospholipid synthase family protein [Vibrio salinus]MCE0496241.1 cyclopropane-fatty-acyl-phospholipid synthase family protein [Vibrio salinus]
MLKSGTIGRRQELSRRAKLARSIIFKCLSKLDTGHLIVDEKFGDPGHGSQHHFGRYEEKGHAEAMITIHDMSVYQRVLSGGSIAAAEAYMDGEWDSPDLTGLMKVMALNQESVDLIEAKTAFFTGMVYKFRHWLNKNSLRQSKENIHSHYDLGNDFYRLFLDERMLYSSALFELGNDDLAEAQLSKMDRLCQELELNSGDHVLEIGTGWGGMAIYMASRYGCRVTTTTISDQQFHYAQKKIQFLGLENQITLLRKDYRELEGRYDKLVSIEMVEAVGKEYLNDFITKCNDLIKPEGKMAIQAITISDQRYQSYSQNVDFIQKYIFPGGFLPSLNALLQSTTHYSRLNLRSVKDIGLDYARTLNHWRKEFESKIEQVEQLGYDQRFIRMWRYYLCYCEGGFLAKAISTVQLTFEKQK